MVRKAVVDLDYFLDRSAVDPATGCWEWQMFRNASGYGKLSPTLGGLGEQLAHRLAYRVLALDGAMIVGEIDHLCRNRCCINPAHMEDVPHQINMQRAPLNSFIAPRAQQTHCVNGHEYNEANTRRNNGQRYCILCKRAASERLRARRKNAHAVTNCSPRL